MGRQREKERPTKTASTVPALPRQLERATLYRLGVGCFHPFKS
jgi:hypothetical protein